MTRSVRSAGVAALAALLLSGPTPAFAQSGEPGLADLQAIEATLYRYTRGLDRLDADLYLSSMAPDVVVVVDADEFRGHDAMREIVAEEAALREATPRTLYHLETNSSIALTAPDRAEHHAYWLTITQTAEGLGILGAGSSTDELRKIDGEWLIVRREILLTP